MGVAAVDLGGVVTAVYRVEQTVVWTVTADSEEQLQDFLDLHGVDFLGQENAIGDAIYKTGLLPSEAGVDLNAILTAMDDPS